jgi:hypothetical protein
MDVVNFFQYIEKKETQVVFWALRGNKDNSSSKIKVTQPFMPFEF